MLTGAAFATAVAQAVEALPSAIPAVSCQPYTFGPSGAGWTGQSSGAGAVTFDDMPTTYAVDFGGGVMASALFSLSSASISVAPAATTPTASSGPIAAAGEAGTFMPIWLAGLTSCSGPVNPGYSFSGPINGPDVWCVGVVQTGIALGVVLHDEGAAITYSFTVPAGTTERVTYGIPGTEVDPAGGHLNQVPLSIAVDDGAPTTVDGCMGATGATTDVDEYCWTSAPLGPGQHTVTITSLGDSNNVYGVWVASTDSAPAATPMPRTSAAAIATDEAYVTQQLDNCVAWTASNSCQGLFSATQTAVGSTVVYTIFASQTGGGSCGRGTVWFFDGTTPVALAANLAPGEVLTVNGVDQNEVTMLAAPPTTPATGEFSLSYLVSSPEQPGATYTDCADIGDAGTDTYVYQWNGTSIVYQSGNPPTPPDFIGGGS